MFFNRCKSKIVGLIVSLLFACLSTSCEFNLKQKLSQDEIKQSLEDSVVKVRCYDFRKEKVLTQGTGFFIDNQGTFITNFHVIDECCYIKITTSSGTEKWVDKITDYNKGFSDCAVCSVTGLNSKKVEFFDSVENGEEVYALGYPNNSNSLVITSGSVINTRIEYDGIEYIENTAEIDHGSSGGILANRYGKVIGMTTCGFSSTYGAIPHSSFKARLTSKAVNKEPIRLFHTYGNVTLSSENFPFYFELDISAVSIYTGLYRITYTIRLKDEFASRVVLGRFSYLNIYVTFSCRFKYYENSNPGVFLSAIESVTCNERFYDHNVGSSVIGMTSIRSSHSNTYQADDVFVSSYEGTSGTFSVLFL